MKTLENNLSFSRIRNIYEIENKEKHASFDLKYLIRVNKKCKQWSKIELTYKEFLEVIMPNHWFCNCSSGLSLNLNDYCFIKTGGYPLSKVSKKLFKNYFLKRKAPKCYKKVMRQKKSIVKNGMGCIFLSKGKPILNSSSIGIKLDKNDLFLLDGLHRALALTLMANPYKRIKCYVAIMI